ncbi:hypothetical protein K461DRAFT_270257 [Myriangium duriaei CBS 260.36]|uniref:Uncharacterized protein n=1 Tax=Myriangium duriaei CBS 260.36 TaxID=1168546 RepID=A0A9P4ME83_9PEZI|nr:hypothetical protein K461DRAFT_270257 [Myriangium duriaei CBS 260.36]
MSIPNGLATPPRQSPDLEPTSGTKRKRVGVREGSANKSSPKQPHITPSIDSTTIADVFEVLSSHDAAPAILNFPIEPDDDSADSHPAKKTKIDQSSPTTVSRKVADRAYGSLEELESDIRGICAAQIASLKEPDEEEDSKTSKRLSGDDVAQMQDIMSFELFAHDVVRRENDFARPPSQTKEAKSNGVKEEVDSKVDETVPAAGRTVLSLFGNAPTPRQLFSSLQEDAATDISLQELGLPTMLVATKLLPTPKDDARSQARTLGELFAPPSTLATLQPPPRQPRLPTHKATSISFLSAEKSVPKPSRKGSYTIQPLTSGKWLRYGSQDTATHKAIKEHLKRGSITTIDLTQDRPRKEPREEDLFASAYSSFAPTRDESRAIIPGDTCDLVWWQKIGKRRTNQMFALDHSQDDMEVDGLDDNEVKKIEEEHELKIYKDLIDNFNEEDMSVEPEDEAQLPADMEAEALLNEINELLRTLASHQRIRHSILPNGTRGGPSSPSPLRNSMMGTPTEPSEDETVTYQHLRDHLAGLVSRLPPYLVAKLNGAQVEDLAVSTTFLVEGRNDRGVMEEDQATRSARGAAAAAAAAASTSTSTTTRPSASSQFSQYGRWGGGLSNNRPALTPQSQQAARNSISYGRSSSGLGMSTPGQPNRQSYSQAGSYTAPVNRTALQPNYGQSGSQQYYSQRAGYGQQSLGQSSPQPQSQARTGQYSAPGQQQFQSQRYSDTASYNHNLNTFAPQKTFNQQRPASTTNSYNTPARPSSNGRSTPVANIAPAIPPHQNSPVKLASNINVAPSPRPNSTTPQPPQTNGV